MDLMEIGWGGVEWIHLARDRYHWQVLLNAVMNLWVLAPRSQPVSQSVSQSASQPVIPPHILAYSFCNC
jgi:hypothetical protein